MGFSNASIFVFSSDHQVLTKKNIDTLIIALQSRKGS